MQITKGKIGFVYDFVCIDKGLEIWRDRIENLIPDEGRDYILEAAMNNGAQFNEWYIALFETSRYPVAADTVATLITASTECTDYDGVRQYLSVLELVNGVYSNWQTPAEFEFTDNITISGGFITSSSAFGSSSGPLLSAGLLPTSRAMSTGQKLMVTAGLSLVPV